MSSLSNQFYVTQVSCVCNVKPGQVYMPTLCSVQDEKLFFNYEFSLVYAYKPEIQDTLTIKKTSIQKSHELKTFYQGEQYCYKNNEKGKISF